MHVLGIARSVRARFGMSAFAVALLVSASTQAADESVGSPKSIAITPAESTLVGRRATGQLIVSADLADGTLSDLTRAVEWVSLDPTIATVSPKGQVVPKANGTATIVARAGSLEAKSTGSGSTHIPSVLAQHS